MSDYIGNSVPLEILHQMTVKMIIPQYHKLITVPQVGKDTVQGEWW